MRARRSERRCGAPQSMTVIQRLDLHAFKAFERFTLRLKDDAYLAGPNNAGKSTLTTALRMSAQMVRIAMRRGPTETFMDGTEQVLGYAFTNSQVGLTDGNLRQTRLSTARSGRHRAGRA